MSVVKAAEHANDFDGCLSPLPYKALPNAKCLALPNKSHVRKRALIPVYSEH